MAIKTFINGQENGVITFKGDTEPCAVYVNGEKQDNISYVPQEVTGETSVSYSSEYKKNIRTMQIDGNTEQYQRAGGDELPLFDLKDWNDLNSPQLEAPDLGTTYTSCIYWSLPINYGQGVFELWLDYMETLSDQELNIVIAYTTDDLINRTGSYQVLYPYTKPVYVDQPFYIGAINPNGYIDEIDQTVWQKYINAITESAIHFITVDSPSPYAPSPIQNAGRLLPDEYQQVEYIESTGTQYIDTDVKGGSNIKIQFEGAFQRITGFSGVTGSRNAYLTDTNANSFCFFANTGNEDYQYYLTSYKTTDMSANKISVEMSKDGIFFNGVLKHQVAQETWSNDYNITIFAINTAGTIGYGKNHKIYSYKLYESSVLIRNFIPCYRKSDNIIGLYDLVNNVFYTNQGTGTFLKGADVNNGIECVLRGANLFDISQVKGGTPITTSNPNVSAGIAYGAVTDGILYLKYGAYSASILWAGAKIPINKSGNYYISCDVFVDETSSTSQIYARLANKTKNIYTTQIYSPSLEKGKWVRYVFPAITVNEDWVGDDIYLGLSSVGNASQHTNMPNYAKNIMVAFENDTGVYEPYFHKTLSLPSSVNVDGQEVALNMGGLSTSTNIPYRSHILVDRIRNKVFYYEYQKLAVATTSGSRLRILQDVVWFQAGYLGVSDWQARPAVCTHFKRYSSITYNTVGFAQGDRSSIIYISLPLTMFADPTNPTKEEVTAWLQSEADKGTPVTFLTTYAEPLEYDLTETEIGQQILDFVNSTQNATNIIEITSTPSVSNLSVNYAKWGGTPNANNT